MSQSELWVKSFKMEFFEIVFQKYFWKKKFQKIFLQKCQEKDTSCPSTSRAHRIVNNMNNNWVFATINMVMSWAMVMSAARPTNTKWTNWSSLHALSSLFCHHYFVRLFFILFHYCCHSIPTLTRFLWVDSVTLHVLLLTKRHLTFWKACKLETCYVCLKGACLFHFQSGQLSVAADDNKKHAFLCPHLTCWTWWYSFLYLLLACFLYKHNFAANKMDW